jgi:RNA polymerase sigma-70 factor, ECF subfamily
MASDEELSLEFIERKPNTLARAYESYARVLNAVARSVLGNSGAAEDCVHEALLRVWQTPGSYRLERGSLRTFLIACVRNEALMTVRSAGRRTAREERAERLRVVPDTAIEVVDHIEAGRVRDALARLPDEQRAAIELVYFGNESHVQAAARLGVPLGTLKSRVSLGVRRLHALMAPAGGS